MSIKIFGIRLMNFGKTRNIKHKKCIIVSNHASYLDILILSALFGTVFISKVEVKYYPIVGQIAWLMGIVFLKRSSHWDRHKVIRFLANGSYRALTIFPQGTTCSIHDSLPFKSGVFKVIELNNGIVIVPVTIHYREDKEIAWRDELLFSNVKKVCSQKAIHAGYKIHDDISIKNYKDKSISEISAFVEKQVLTKLWDE